MPQGHYLNQGRRTLNVATPTFQPISWQSAVVQVRQQNLFSRGYHSASRIDTEEAFNPDQGFNSEQEMGSSSAPSNDIDIEGEILPLPPPSWKELEAHRRQVNEELLLLESPTTGVSASDCSGRT